MRNNQRVFNRYTVAGVVYTRAQKSSIAQKFIIILGITAFVFALGLAGRADFCGQYPHAKECTHAH